MANSSDVIKIGFDYRSSLEQFEKETNGVFDEVRKTANGQRIELEIHASDKNALNKIKELQKEYSNISLELDGKSLGQQIKTIDILKQKLLEIINLFSSGIDMSSIINIGNTITQINRVENKLEELNKQFNELSNKKIDSSISNENLDLSNNQDFKKLTEEVEYVKSEIWDLRDAFEQLCRENSNIGHFAYELDDKLIEVSNTVTTLTKNILELQSALNNTVSNKVDISSNTESSSSIEEETKALKQVSESAKSAANSKKKFAETNEKVKTSADSSSSAIKEESNSFQSAEWNKNVKAIQEYMNAVTKLNNLKASDKGTGIKNRELELQQKKIEELREKALEAKSALSTMINPHDVPIDAWDKWIETMKTFDQASKGSAESVAKLEDTLRNMKNSQINSMQSDIDNFQKILKTRTSTPKDFNQSDAYKQNLKELENAIKSLTEEKEKLTKQESISDEDINRFKELKRVAQEATNTLKNMSAVEKGSTEHSRMKEYDKIGEYIKKNTKMSKEFRQELEALQYQLKNGGASINVKDIDNQFLKLKDRIREARQEGKSFIDIFNTKVVYGFVSQITMYYLSFYDFIRYARNAITAITELDTALVDLQKTTAMSASQLEDFYLESNDTAKQMGVTTKEIITQASAWSRLSYSTKGAATEMAKLSSQFASISPGMGVEDATDGLVSIMKAFDVDVKDVKSEIMDKVNTLGNNFAESNQDVVEGLKRSSAAMDAMNQSFEDTAALFTGGMEILQDAETMGTALRSLSMRLRGYSEDSVEGFEELDESLSNITGDLIDLTKTAENAEGISIYTDETKNLDEANKKYKSLVEYLGEISDAWDTFSETQQTNLLQTMFGKTRAQAGAAIITNFDAVRDSLEAMENSAGSADREMSIIEDSLEYKINALKETWVGNAQKMIDRGDFGEIIDSLTKLSEAIGFVIDKMGVITPMITTFGMALQKKIGLD